MDFISIKSSKAGKEDCGFIYTRVRPGKARTIKESPAYIKRFALVLG